MFAISAADAVAPAIQRTRTFLFRPFRLGTYLKLCLVACITEGMGSFQFSSSGGHASHHRSNLFSSAALTPGRVAILVVAALILFVLGFVLFYLVTRLRFAYFHCLIHKTKEIRPGWHLYRTQATRFFWFNLVVGFCFLLVVALIALPFVAGFWRLLRNLPPGGHPAVRSVLSLLLPLIPILLLLILAAIAADFILRDFMLPHFALENATAGEAWSTVLTRIKAEKGSFLLYAVLRILLPVAALIVLILVLIIPAILFVAAIVIAEVGIHAAFSNATSAAAIVGIFLQVLIGSIAFAVAMLVAIGLGGPLSTAIREYALLFYGGRYRPLGDILWPPELGPGAPGIA